MVKKSILLIEDDAMILDALEKLLRTGLSFEAEVATATNTADALAALKRGRFDLVFSDNRFPRHNDGQSKPEADQGLEIMWWMWIDDDYRNTPFILHTSDTSDEVAEEVRKHGATLITKPKPFGVIKETVEAALRAASH